MWAFKGYQSQVQAIFFWYYPGYQVACIVKSARCENHLKRESKSKLPLHGSFQWSLESIDTRFPNILWFWLQFFWFFFSLFFVSFSTRWLSMAKRPCSFGCLSKASFFTIWQRWLIQGGQNDNHSFTFSDGVSAKKMAIKRAKSTRYNTFPKRESSLNIRMTGWKKNNIFWGGITK